MSRLVKVGVAGVGHMGKEHARIYSESKGAELVGVHDSNPETARKIAEKCKTRAFSSLEEMVEAVEPAVLTGTAAIDDGLARAGAVLAGLVIGHAQEAGLAMPLDHVQRAA